MYDGDYEGKTSVTLKSGEKMIFSNDVVTQMFKKTLTQQGSGFNVYNALVTLGFSSKEILEEVCGLLIRKSDAWKSLANSIRKILEG